MIEHLVVHREQKQDVAIVFVHGFGGNPRKTWGNFPQFLAADRRLATWDLFSLGYPTDLWFDLMGIWRANPDIGAVALLLRTTAAERLDRYQRLAFIAHSMGGLVVQRALADDEALAARTGRVFFFGTPSDGLVKATFFRFWKPQLDNMAEGGEFITALRKSWRERFPDPWAGFRYWVIAGDRDEFVPRRSSLAPFTADRQEVVPGDHLTMVKPKAADELSVRLVLAHLIGQAAPAGPGDAARRAVEEREFQAAVRLLQPQQADLDEAGLVQLALALDGLGRQAEAIRALERVRPDQTDAMGVLAGRLKRRWLVERREADARRAQELYQSGFAQAEAAGRHDQAFYLGINVAFMKAAYGNDLAGAGEVARKVLGHCRQVGQADMWRLATEGEAHLLLGECDVALERYRRAVASQPPPKPWQLDSMFQQAVRVASLLNDTAAADRLTTLFRGE